MPELAIQKCRGSQSSNLVSHFAINRKPVQKFQYSGDPHYRQYVEVISLSFRKCSHYCIEIHGTDSTHIASRSLLTQTHNATSFREDN